MLVIKMQMGDIVFNPIRIGAFSGDVINFNDGCKDLLGEYKNNKRAQEGVDDLYKYMELVAGTPSTLFTYIMPKE